MNDVAMTKYYRFSVLCQENEALTRNIHALMESRMANSMAHASTIHHVNKDMSIFREQMESALRRELTAMELTYQHAAFRALGDPKKASILKNSKLQDEVSLQGVGIANLTTRLVEQERSIATCRTKRKSLAVAAGRVRFILGVLTKTKTLQATLLDDLDICRAALDVDKLLMLDKVRAGPGLRDLFDEISRVYDSVQKFKSNLVILHHRLVGLEGLRDSLKPVSISERAGHYNALAFTSGATLHKSTENDERTSDENGEAPLKLSDVHEFLRRHEPLQIAFNPLKGKESNLITSYSTEGDQNMLAWVTAKVRLR
jgi:hypothetical protein